MSSANYVKNKGFSTDSAVGRIGDSLLCPYHLLYTFDLLTLLFAPECTTCNFSLDEWKEGLSNPVGGLLISVDRQRTHNRRATYASTDVIAGVLAQASQDVFRRWSE